MQNTIQYKGYTIRRDSGLYKFFPSADGEDDDFDLVGEDYRYCGNGKWANSVDDAKDQITSIIREKRGPIEVRVNGKVETFCDFIVAVKATIETNGELLTPIHSI